MKQFSIVILFSLLSFSMYSQRGKDGAGAITAANTIVNAYTALNADASVGNTTITVASSSGINPGDLIFIIQMQGTRVNAGKDTIYPDVSSSIPTTTAFGDITNYFNTGNNEFAQVSAVPNGTSLVLDCGLQKDYSYLGHAQVVKVPRYTSLTVSGTGNITAPAWNGTTGGVAVVEVQNNTVLSSTPSFSLTGKGFRGGGVEDATTFGGNKFGSINPMQGGYKGESIAGDTNRYKVFAGVFCRGAVANGGGGGDAHNAGGGGGANGGVVSAYNGLGNTAAGYAAAWNLEGAGFATHTSSGGGRGGYTFSATNQNVTTKAPGNTSWGGDNRFNVGGFGGRPLDYSTGRLFLGGGGGTGDSNDGYARPGGNGGGLVYILSYGTISGAGTIAADGAAALNTNNSGLGCTGKDAGSGGGGGGTIILNSVGAISLSAGTALSATGGKGGNQNFGGGCTSTEAYGPGGGGGGGYIATSGTLPSNTVAGGANGIVTGNASNIAASFPPNGATIGGAGSSGAVSTPTLSVTNPTICANQSLTLTATSSNASATINWYAAAAGGAILASGNTYAPATYTAAGTYTVYAGSCPGTYREPVTITVNSGLNITVNSPTICPGQAATLTATGATNYTWTPGGATTSSITASPAATAVYTVNGTSGTCSGMQTATITVSPQPTVTVANATVCAGGTATLTANGATTYTWMPGGQTTMSISVSPSVNTTYSVTGSNGACTNSTTATVSIAASPTISVASASICTGQTGTLTASGAITYTWNPGNVTGSTYTASPAGNTTYTIVGTAATCTAQATASITVISPPVITVNSPTICPGQTVTLTASGATNYTWMPGGATTSSISASPAATSVYTVDGMTGMCSATQTATITVAPQPTVTVANATICAGGTATLTANGATSYTWMPGGQTTTSILVSPATTTSYSITGLTGACTNSTTATVSVTPTPTLSVASVTICPSQTATLTASGATSYTWNPGNVTGATYTVSPAVSSTYTVLGSSSSCTAQATASVTIGSSISITVNSPTICAGQTATLTASGAATYTWSGSGANTGTIQVSPSASTVYTVSGTGGSCSGTGTSTVTVNAVPTLTVSSTSPICSGQTSTLSVSGAASYTWSNGASTGTQTVSPLSTTVYTVSGLTNGCTGTGSTTVTVNQTPTLTVNSATICPGNSATLTASGASSYTWSPGQTTSSIVVSPAATAVFTVTGANGNCAKTATTQVLVNASSAITAAVSNNTGCAPVCATFNVTNSASCGTLTINYGDGSSGTSLSHCYTAQGYYTVSAVCTSTNGCTSSYTIPTPIDVIPSPVASFNIVGGSIVTAGSTVQLQNTSTNAVMYNWTLCNGNISGASDPSVAASDTGSCCITLIATGANNCKDTAMQCIQVMNEALVSIPNVFTPNGDNVNDFFKIASSGLKTLHVSVFDRWGLKMYEWEGLNGYWDGKSKTGAAAPAGTYFFIYDYTDMKDKDTSGKGFLSLLKE